MNQSEQYPTQSDISWMTSEREPEWEIKGCCSRRKIATVLATPVGKNCRDAIECFTYYGMHDAPGGKQNPESFRHKDGTVLCVGDETEFVLCWSFLNPWFQNKLLEVGLLDENGYKTNPVELYNGTLRQILIDYKTEYESNEEHVSEYYEKNVDELILSPIRLKQAWMAISTKKGDIVYVRGKKGKLNEGWLFEVQDSSKINYIKPQKDGHKSRSTKTFKVIKKVSNEVYESLPWKRASMWELNQNEIELLSVVASAPQYPAPNTQDPAPNTQYPAPQYPAPQYPEPESEDEMEVDPVEINGITYYKDDKDVLWDPESGDEVGKYVDGKLLAN